MNFGRVFAVFKKEMRRFFTDKRMLAARGKPVVYLKRLSMGPIQLDPGLAPGAWRPLTWAEREVLEGTHGS